MAEEELPLELPYRRANSRERGRLTWAVRRVLAKCECLSHTVLGHMCGTSKSTGALPPVP